MKRAWQLENKVRRIASVKGSHMNLTGEFSHWLEEQGKSKKRNDDEYVGMIEQMSSSDMCLLRTKG